MVRYMGQGGDKGDIDSTTSKRSREVSHEGLSSNQGNQRNRKKATRKELEAVENEESMVKSIRVEGDQQSVLLEKGVRNMLDFPARDPAVVYLPVLLEPLWTGQVPQFRRSGAHAHCSLSFCHPGQDGRNENRLRRCRRNREKSQTLNGWRQP